MLIFLFVMGSKREITVAAGADDFTVPIATVNPVCAPRGPSLEHIYTCMCANGYPTCGHKEIILWKIFCWQSFFMHSKSNKIHIVH
jgi:hypothetical protein